jgi:2OG-Fe(II) oxygenase superfamily
MADDDLELKDGWQDRLGACSVENVLGDDQWCWLVHDAVSAFDCADLIARCESLGICKVIDWRGPPYRRTNRLQRYSRALATQMLELIRRNKLLPDIVDVDSSRADKAHLHGRWQLHDVSMQFRVCRYDKVGDGFGVHRDGNYERSNSELSLFTFMLYLNGDFEGGSTDFRGEGVGAPVIGRVQPSAGLLVLFWHWLLHEGAPLTKEGTKKYILRADVIYRLVGKAETNVERTDAAQSQEIENLALELMLNEL